MYFLTQREKVNLPCIIMYELLHIRKVMSLTFPRRQKYIILHTCGWPRDHWFGHPHTNNESW